MIKIFYTTDIHGYIMDHRYSDNQKSKMGLVKISKFIKENRDENSIYIDNGDILEGSQLLDYYYENGYDFNPIKEAMEIAGVDYVNIGNHDFNYGTKVLNDYLYGFKCITTNINYQGKPLGKTIIHTFKNNIKVAIIGVCTSHIFNWEKPENLVNIDVYDAFSVLKKEVNKVKSEVDYVVAVYHGGFEKDIETGKIIDELNGENQGYQMCDEIEGIDLFLTGHQHRLINTKMKNTKIIQLPSQATSLAYIEIDKNIECKIIELNNCNDLEIENKLLDIENKTQKWLDQNIRELPYDLLIKNQFEARLYKHPLVSFLNQIQLHYSKADFSAVALFNNAIGFSKNFTIRELTSTYVYPNSLEVLETDYENLKLFLEKTAEYFMVENNNIVVNKDFYEIKPQHYNYDMLDGIEYTIKVSNPIGQRIISLTRNGKELPKDKKYTLVVNNYRGNGGGDFYMVKNMKRIKSIDTNMVKLIYDYVKNCQELKINHQDNIKVIL